MTLFFFLVSLELKRELVLGELRGPRYGSAGIAVFTLHQQLIQDPLLLVVPAHARK